jgi:N-methylhydantoinase A
MAKDAGALVEPGARGAPVTERRLAYMRYVGQGHEITVPLPVRDLTADDAATLRETFEREYSVLFRRPIPGAAIEALSWSVLISTKAERPAAMNGAPEQRAPSPDGSRSFFDGRAGRSIDVPFYRRERMEAGVRVPGPAIIAEDETSTFVTASFDARIDAAGCIVMERRG